MKIGFETERLNRPPSGPKTYRANLGRALLEVNSDIKIFGFQFSDFHHKLFEHPRVEKFVLPSIPGLVERRLSRMPVDIIHVGAGLHQYPFLASIDQPIVSTIHGIEPLILEEYEVPLKSILQKKYIWPQLARFLDQVIVVSNSAKQQFLCHYPVEDSAVKAIYNGINHETYKPQSQSKVRSTLDQYGIQEPYFFSVGGFSHRKNPETLISAFESVAAELESVSLVIAGPGWKSDTGEELLKNSEYRDQISRLGKIPEQDLPPLYSGAAAFVSPTRHENFGIAIVEAMACGTPVIVSGIYAVPEVTGDAGFLVDHPTDVTGFSSAMVELATDAELRSNYSEAGIKRANEFAWERCARETLDIYQRML